MNSNIQVLSRQEAFRIPIDGLPPLRGWAIKYISGLDEAVTQPGDLLSHWQHNGEYATVVFEPRLHMCLPEETAKEASEFLRQNDIVTELVKVG